MAVIVPSYVKKYAREDINEAVSRVNDELGSDITVESISFDASESEEDLIDNGGDYSSAISIVATAQLNYDDEPIEFSIEYFVGDDEVYVGGSMVDVVEGLKSQLADSDIIESSQQLNGDSITAAADDDEFDDQLTDMSDTIDDMQDTLDEVVEDDPGIEIDNNITDHYIAECDRCHGVFISAMVESDQEIEFVSGVCPLCGKESDQYLKWIIRDVGDVEEEVEVELAPEYQGGK